MTEEEFNELMERYEKSNFDDAILEPYSQWFKANKEKREEWGMARARRRHAPLRNALKALLADE